MTDLNNTTTGMYSVGDRGQTHRPGTAAVSGTVVEDYCDYLLRADQLGRDWAPPHRWAVALDFGTLVFVDDQNITALRSVRHPAPKGGHNDPGTTTTDKPWA